MRVFICLSIFSFMLVTCQGKCFLDHLRKLLKDGKVEKVCLDRYDEEPHPIWSGWSTAECFICECSRAGMRCCQRSHGTVLVERCKKGENPESYKDGGPGLDDKCRVIIPVGEESIEIVRGRKSE